MRSRRVSRTLFDVFAAVERDALGVLAESDQAEAQVGLDALLLKVQADQRSPDQVGQHAAEDGVEHRDPHHVARDLQAQRASAQRERPGNGPQDGHE